MAGTPGDPAAAAQGRTIRVAVSIDPAVAAKLRPGTPLFVSARQPGIPGPPLAAVRLTADQLPTTVTLSDANSMIEGRNLSSVDDVEIIARVAFGGTAITASGDLVGSAVQKKGGDARSGRRHLQDPALGGALGTTAARQTAFRTGEFSARATEQAPGCHDGRGSARVPRAGRKRANRSRRTSRGMRPSAASMRSSVRNGYVPLTFPHVLAMPLHMGIFANAAFPLRPSGLIHLTNTIALPGELRPGMSLDLHTLRAQLSQDGCGPCVRHGYGDSTSERQVVWSENCVFLSRWPPRPSVRRAGRRGRRRHRRTARCWRNST